MIKIGLISDLHSEFWQTSDHPIIERVLDRLADADLILLPGDIGVGTDSASVAKLLFPERPVMLLAGNHEFYDGDYDTVLAGLQARSGGDFHFLHQSVIPLTINGTAIRVIGTTLWTDFELFGGAPLALLAAARGLNDFGVIRYRGHLLTPQDTLMLHREQRAWLFDALEVPFDGLTIMMTHHAPVSFASHPRYVSDPLTPCFASRLDDLLVRDDLALVVWGHTHHCVDRTIGRTRFVSNQTGYPVRISGSDQIIETGQYGQIIEL